MYEYCRPGEKVLKSGIYRVSHAPDCAGDHEVTCVFGRVFPTCNKCGDRAQFSLTRYAADVETHQLFRPERDDNPTGSEVLGKRHRQVWTDEELVRLEALVNEGKTMSEVAEQLERSEEATKTRVQRCGLILVARG